MIDGSAALQVSGYARQQWLYQQIRNIHVMLHLARGDTEFVAFLASAGLANDIFKGPSTFGTTS